MNRAHCKWSRYNEYHIPSKSFMKPCDLINGSHQQKTIIMLPTLVPRSFCLVYGASATRIVVLVPSFYSLPLATIQILTLSFGSELTTSLDFSAYQTSSFLTLQAVNL